MGGKGQGSVLIGVNVEPKLSKSLFRLTGLTTEKRRPDEHQTDWYDQEPEKIKLKTVSTTRVLFLHSCSCTAWEYSQEMLVLCIPVRDVLLSCFLPPSVIMWRRAWDVASDDAEGLLSDRRRPQKRNAGFLLTLRWNCGNCRVIISLTQILYYPVCSARFGRSTPADDRCAVLGRMKFFIHPRESRLRVKRRRIYR